MPCIKGDLRDPGAYQRALGGERADALVTDPPYCLLTRRRKGGDLHDPKGAKIERGPVLRFETVRDYRAFTQDWLSLATKHLWEKQLYSRNRQRILRLYTTAIEFSHCRTLAV